MRLKLDTRNRRACHLAEALREPPLLAPGSMRAEPPPPERALTGSTGVRDVGTPATLLAPPPPPTLMPAKLPPSTSGANETAGRGDATGRWDWPPPGYAPVGRTDAPPPPLL